MTLAKTHLVIFYDGRCPLCLAEISALRARDHLQQMTFVNLHQANFSALYPQINKQEALQHIHGLLNGRLITGIDVNFHAWTLVGKRRWVMPLHWPITRPFAQLGYRLFARFRHQISAFYAFVSGQEPVCKAEGVCKTNKGRGN